MTLALVSLIVFLLPLVIPHFGNKTFQWLSAQDRCYDKYKSRHPSKDVFDYCNRILPPISNPYTLCALTSGLGLTVLVTSMFLSMLQQYLWPLEESVLFIGGWLVFCSFTSISLIKEIYLVA